MYEYTIYNHSTKETLVLQGYDVRDALRRAKLQVDPSIFEVTDEEYID